MLHNRFNQHVQHVIGPQTDFIACQTNNAWISRPKHLDTQPVAQADLFQPVYVVGISSDATNEGGLSGGQLVQGNGFFNHDHQVGMLVLCILNHSGPLSNILIVSGKRSKFYNNAPHSQAGHSRLARKMARMPVRRLEYK